MTKVASYRSWGTDFSDWAFRTQTDGGVQERHLQGDLGPGRDARTTSAAGSKPPPKTRRRRRSRSCRSSTTPRRPPSSRQVLKAEQAKDREAEQSSGRKLQTAISFGATILSALVGQQEVQHRHPGPSHHHHARRGPQHRRGRRRQAGRGDVGGRQAEAGRPGDRAAGGDRCPRVRVRPESETLEKVLMRPRKSDITVDALGLVWMPYWKDASGTLTGAWG